MNLFKTLIAAVVAVAATAPTASALKPKEYPDTLMIPKRAVVVSGDETKSGSLMAILYDTSDLHFTDPSAPRFLFLDRQGKVALGIGGYVKGTVQYDFGGSINDGASFITYDIPVPMNPAQRNQFYGNANHSTIFLQLVGHSEKFGYYQMYIQTNFSGDGATGYGLKLKQAYLKVGYVTVGLANSTFVDGAAGTPTIEDQGPAGEVSRKNILVRYAPRFSDHLSGAIGVEVPQASLTINTPEGADPTVAKINQRVPDIPAYVQYEWDGGKSHVRLSGLFRDLSYRNLVSGQNSFRAGWAIELSGKIMPIPALSLFYQGAYGQGYGSYLNDLDGHGMDLIQSSVPGKMTAPRLANFELGVRYDFRPNIFMAATYSQARVLRQGTLSGSDYRYGQYLSVSGFWDIVPDLRVGLSYLHGNRANFDRSHGHANSVMGMLQYSF